MIAAIVAYGQLFHSNEVYRQFRDVRAVPGSGAVVLFSSHELETVEKVCRHVVILHNDRIVADDSIERLRHVMAAPSLERVFELLAVEVDVAAVSREIADLVGA